jgi:hypothetical protein
MHFWRRGWDSNPRYLAVRLISSQVHSATLPPLLCRAAILAGSVYRAPTLFTSCNALPPEGVHFSLGRPCGKTGLHAACRFAYCAAPEGAVLASCGKRSGCKHRHAAHIGLQHQRHLNGAVSVLVILVAAASLNFAARSLAFTEITQPTVQATSRRPCRAATPTAPRRCRRRAGNFPARPPGCGLRRGRNH